ncbi:MAG: hypothetical protein ACK40S_03110 [Burkholderiaceae bacterium]
MLLLAVPSDPQAPQLRAALQSDARIAHVALWCPVAHAVAQAAPAPADWTTAVDGFSHLLLCHPAPQSPTASAPPQGGADAEVWALRQALQRIARSYQVLHGPLHTQIARAKAALGLPGDDDALQDRMQRLRPWACEKCSDPACEHQLFTALKAERERHSGDP